MPEDAHNLHECMSEMDSCYDEFGSCQCVITRHCYGDGEDYACPSETECVEIYNSYQYLINFLVCPKSMN